MDILTKYLPMNNEYIIKEYELCFEQLRFYDTRQEELLKYLATLTSAVATAQFALFKAFGTTSSEFLGHRHSCRWLCLWRPCCFT